ncbi:GtrA family protein [Candidatus Woesearchaeota archaeon]|nr:GtrA family protein [Candidatus Woesearchaeota archaeon]
MKLSRYLDMFVKYAFGGALSITVKLGLTYLLTEVFDVWYFISYIVALSTQTMIGFFYSAYITFNERKNKRRNFLRFCMTLTVMFTLDAGMVTLLVEILHMAYMAAIIAVTLFLFILKFFVFRFIVFTS